MDAGKAVVLLSGGIDSAACAHLLLGQCHQLESIFVDYGQKARESEWLSAQAVAKWLNIPISRITVQAATSFDVGEVIGRNAFFVSLALLVSGSSASIIALGTHAGTKYYDCSSGFIEQVSTLVAQQTDGQSRVFAPFSEWSKKEVHDYFERTGMPISITYSCETGAHPPCELCPSCLDREALRC